MNGWWRSVAVLIGFRVERLSVIYKRRCAGMCDVCGWMLSGWVDDELIRNYVEQICGWEGIGKNMSC